jgi:hypothetical protein
VSFGTEAVVEEASGAMAPRFVWKGMFNFVSKAGWDFLLMPHLVTNNHA